MSYYLLIAHSSTHAQHMDRALKRMGMRCWIVRSPRSVTQYGCGYSVQISDGDLERAIQILHREMAEPVRIYLCQQGGCQEVLM